MNKKGIFLFLALLLPVLIYVFLKLFGKNEFNVEPLFQDSKVAVDRKDCGPISFPYKISADVLNTIITANDSLALICFDGLDEDSKKEFPRLKEELRTDPIRITITDPGTESQSKWYECIFIMSQPSDMVLVDRKGTIRGQYESSDRDEIDRLKTEITIILKRY